MSNLKKTLLGTILLSLAFAFQNITWSQTADSLDEIQLGLRNRTAVLNQFPEIKGTKEDAMAREVFNRLLNTYVVRYSPNLPYQVTVIKSDEIQAFSSFGGQIYLSIGLAKILGDNDGLWAAVIGHEMGHSIGRHHYKSYLRQLQLQRLVAETGTSWVTLSLELVNLKLERNQEHEADQDGLRMMVDAGYHPAFAISLYRKMGRILGDDSKLAAFFSTHPRWNTREERTKKAYDEAVTQFGSKWPDPVLSPGGAPPPLATIGIIKATRNTKEKEVLITVPYDVINGRGVPIGAAVFFYQNKKPVPTSDSTYQVGGQLAAWTAIQANSSAGRGTVTIRIPSSALGTKNRKVKAIVNIYSNGEFLDVSKEIGLSFPKIK